jgi:hypothetical protein
VAPLHPRDRTGHVRLNEVLLHRETINNHVKTELWYKQQVHQKIKYKIKI